MNRWEHSGTPHRDHFESILLGSYRYHAHSEVQRADGLYGGLIIHNPISPPENITYEYDHELLFLVGDWYHEQAEKVLGMFMRRISSGVEVCS